MNDSLNEEQLKQLKSLLDNNQPIMAIKTYREFTGADLFSAKAFVQSIQAKPTYLDAATDISAHDISDSSIEPLKWHHRKEVPEQIEKLINPEHLLHQDVKFIPALSVTRFEVGFQWFIVFLLVCLTAGISHILLNSVNQPALWIQATVVGISVGFVAIGWWSLKKKTAVYKNSQSLLAQGKYRQGVLLFKNALLINFNDHFYFARKSNIDCFTATFRGRSQGRHLEMTLKKQNQKITMGLDFLKLNNVIMQKELTAWLRQRHH